MAVLVTISLAGLLVLTGFAADRWSRVGHRDGGGPGRDQPRPIPIRSKAGTDAELFRILDDARFGDLRLSHRTDPDDHRPATA